MIIPNDEKVPPVPSKDQEALAFPAEDDLPPSYEELLAELEIRDPHVQGQGHTAGPSSPPVRSQSYPDEKASSPPPGTRVNSPPLGNHASLPPLAPRVNSPPLPARLAARLSYAEKGAPQFAVASHTSPQGATSPPAEPTHQVPFSPSPPRVLAPQSPPPSVGSPPPSISSPPPSVSSPPPNVSSPPPSDPPSSSFLSIPGSSKLQDTISRTSSHTSLRSVFTSSSPSTKPQALTKTQIDIRTKVLQLLQLLITHHTDSSIPANVRAGYGIIKGASSACQAYGLNFSALLALRFVGDHSVVYWATVKRAKHAQYEEEEEDPLLRSLYSFCERPLDPGLAKELRRGCVAHSDEMTWRRYLASTEVSEAERTLLSLDMHLTPADIVVLEHPDQNGQGKGRIANLNEQPDVLESFSVAITFDQFLTRMKELRRVETTFIAHQRLWRVVLRDDNVVEIELGEDSPTVFVDATVTVFALGEASTATKPGSDGDAKALVKPSGSRFWGRSRTSSTTAASSGNASPDKQVLSPPGQSLSPPPTALQPGPPRSRTQSFNDQAAPTPSSSTRPYIPIPSLSYHGSPSQSILQPSYELTLRSPSHINPLLPPPSTYAQPTGKAAWKDTDVSVADLIKDMEKTGSKKSNNSNPDPNAPVEGNGKGKGKSGEGGGVTVGGGVGAVQDGSGSGEVPVVVKATKKGKADREKGRVVSVATKAFAADEDGRLRIRLGVRFVRPDKESSCVVC